MKLLKYIIVFSVTLITSCSDDYFDVNSSETAPSTESLPPQYRIQGAIENTTGTAQYRGTREVLGIMQYGSQNVADYYSETWSSSLTTGRYFLWQNAYVYSLPNTADLIVLGKKYNAPNYVAVGKILRAYILGMTTDQYGDIVIGDTYDGESSMNITPKFVTQKEAYQTILQMLDEAIEELNQASEIDLNQEDGDVLYQGNQENWIKFANSIKARYLNHLSKKSSGDLAYDADAIIEACNNAINSNVFNAQKNYGGGEMENDNQPFSENGYGSSRFDYFSDFFVELLKNPLQLEPAYEDPRLPLIVPEAVNGGYHGVVTGSGLGDASGDDFSVGNGGFYTSPDSPTYMFTYSEVKFISAEAKFRKGDLEGAYVDFKEGVKADLEKVTVAPEKINEYLAKLDDEVGSTNISLSHIFVQKYIANMLNPETWVDMRRADYSSDIYPGLQRPENVNLDIFPNEDDWIQAMMYEYNEEDRNYENMPDNNPNVRLTTPLWWNTEE
ncbi:SusD/RagB family nutrient-binding outer membrane lipoprotein [Maribacter polysiphoniae]|uniref:SusD-like starch-binding protein associating with outer membrane n=1 Tax=Maribacter polysiphoniae TaxID=429344 RepID=A0A316DZR2_9FLAO|nr:SusD/RagB family nutrient-binding outer membrane lipoprotein [Maribacter polysiphoniae]MBD1261115.1 SusD/RagB family nutrient-binding outer membrane lipoprotein [Maribacter polysiphoniae]PWK23644.1 SusD-like starch-binding protein associating with outer membrane [Maribacter polysiphoniae]